MYEEVTYEEILERMLERVPDDMDKREGSLIYDALAPAAIELQIMYIELDVILKETTLPGSFYSDGRQNAELCRKKQLMPF